MENTYILASPPNVVAKTYPMLQKLTLPLSKESILVLQLLPQHFVSAPYPITLLMSGHCPPTTAQLWCCFCATCWIAANFAFALQLPLICCCYNCNNCNWEASKILNQLCLVIHLSHKSWPLLASTLFPEESALRPTLHWSTCSVVNTALRSSKSDSH